MNSFKRNSKGQRRSEQLPNHLALIIALTDAASSLGALDINMKGGFMLYKDQICLVTANALLDLLHTKYVEVIVFRVRRACRLVSP